MMTFTDEEIEGWLVRYLRSIPRAVGTDVERAVAVIRAVAADLPEDDRPVFHAATVDGELALRIADAIAKREGRARPETKRVTTAP